MKYLDNIDQEINRKEKSRFFKKRFMKEPAGYCEKCGGGIYKKDCYGDAYRLCYKCVKIGT